MHAQHVLVVEDQAIVARDIADQIADLGYEVCGIANRAEEAEQKALETRPDAIMMDIRLRGSVDGVETASRIKKNLDAAVVFLTAFTDAETLARAKEVQPAGFLVKPFTRPQLAMTLDIALQGGRAANTAPADVLRETAWVTFRGDYYDFCEMLRERPRRERVGYVLEVADGSRYIIGNINADLSWCECVCLGPEAPAPGREDYNPKVTRYARLNLDRLS